MNKLPRFPALSTIIQKLRKLNLTEKCKSQLRRLWHQVKAMIQQLVNWIADHREFCSSIALGLACAYLFYPVPLVGPILATLCVVLSIIHGIGYQQQADLRRHFYALFEGTVK